jgi:hypothetical protein
MRLRLAGISVTLAALAVAQTGAAVPERDQVIRMGKGIGKVQLGMTMPAVRRALGRRHDIVNRRQNFGARGRYLELAWEFPGASWDTPVVWNVGFRSWSRRGTLRVVRVSTTTPRQRTPKGLGVGTRSRNLARAYRDATCVLRFNELSDDGVFIVIDAPGAGMTVFEVAEKPPVRARRKPYYVVSVLVQRTWFSEGRGHEPCPSGWEDW